MAGLGRGLSSLLSESKKYKEEKLSSPSPEKENGQLDNNKGIVDIELDKLEPSVYQAKSITEHGLLEPLLVK